MTMEHFDLYDSRRRPFLEQVFFRWNHPGNFDTDR